MICKKMWKTEIGKYLGFFIFLFARKHLNKSVNYFEINKKFYHDII